MSCRQFGSAYVRATLLGQEVSARSNCRSFATVHSRVNSLGTQVSSASARCSRAFSSAASIAPPSYLQISRFRHLSAVGTISLVTIAKSTRALCRKTMTDEISLEHNLQNADQLFDENHFQEVIELLNKYPDQESSEIQWRKSRAFYSLAKSAKDKTERENLIRQSYELIQKALMKDDHNFAIHKWMAIVMDANAELDGIKARVSQLESMKSHINRSIELNPEDPTSWHLMGSFEYGLADLPWIQRKIVSAIFATPPTGTYEKALECFEKAESIKPGFYSSNWLMAGKCCLALKKPDQAKSYLEKAANCRVLNEDDKKSKEEAAQLLKKL